MHPHSGFEVLTLKTKNVVIYTCVMCADINTKYKYNALK
jgi:hypothetical protein